MIRLADTARCRSSKPAATVTLCGARFDGLQQTVRGERLVLFTDPITGTTCGLFESQVTLAAVWAKLDGKRADYAA